MSKLATAAAPSSTPKREPDRLNGGSSPGLLDPARLPVHVDALYRAAFALCGSRSEAEDLVQETVVRILKRPRFVRRDRERAYLLRALRNTYSSAYRRAARQPRVRAISEDEARAAPEPVDRAGEIMRAIAGTPASYRDAVIAVDVVGLSYAQAARALRARQATVASRLYRGRQHVGRVLIETDHAH